MVDSDRLSAAYETARCDLLAECDASGHWTGRLASSALSTATAISALALVERHSPTTSQGLFADEKRREYLSQVIIGGLHWLVRHQNEDGGWGDTDKSTSNIATTMLVRAAFALTCVPRDAEELLERADQYIADKGGVRGLRRRYGRDKTFAAPILTNCALAGLVHWRDVPALPFELAALSQDTWKSLRLPVVSYAIPALVAIGQARYHHRKPWNPITRLVRSMAVEKTLRVLDEKQPESGGFLEATPLTSFVVMSLASIGRANHPVVVRGVEFLLASLRPDGSWPIDTNLATWNTTLAVNALAAGGEDVGDLNCLDWILSCQHQDVHPYTGAAPGAWAWTDLSGGVPDADDTAGALLALANMAASGRTDDDLSHGDTTTQPTSSARILTAAQRGVGWMLDLQNSDGGWPTFCKGWGTLPFDRSGSDLTAHAIRALTVWKSRIPNQSERIVDAVERGFRYLAGTQDPTGSWSPLWFGNQWHAKEENPVYGTVKVLLAYRDAGRLDTPPARRALDWLSAAQNRDGGWGGRPASEDLEAMEPCSSVEETALAVEALLSCGRAAAHEAAGLRGLEWLVDAVEANRHQDCSPIGFYFAKLWYYEKLYPLTFTVAALGRAARKFLPRPTRLPTLHFGNT